MGIVASQIVAEVLVQGALDAISQLNAVGAANDMASMASGGFLGSLGNLGGGLLDMISTAGMAVMSLEMFGQMAVQVGGMLIGPDAEMEQMTVAFTTLMHSSRAAKDELQQLSNFAAKTPFQMMDLDAASAKLLAFGESSKELIPDLTAIGDALSALGEATPARLGMIVDIFGKIDTTGKLTGGIMMQFSRDGINAWQALADASGKTIPVLQEMVKKGLIPASEATQWLRTGLEKMYGGGMAAQAQTFNGLMSTFKDNIQAAWRAFSGPLFDMAKAGLQQLGDLVASPVFQNFAVTAGQVLADALARVGALVAWVIRQFQVWSNLLANNPTWQLFISEIVDGWNAVMDAFSAFGDWISSMWPSVMQVIQVGWDATIGVLVQGLTWIVGEIHDFAGQWNTVWAAILNNPYVQALIGMITSTFNTIKNAMMSALKWIQDAIGNTGNWIVQAWQALQSNPVFKALEGLAISVFNGIKTAAVAAADWIQHHWDDMVAAVQRTLLSLWGFVGPIFVQIGAIVQGAFTRILNAALPVIDWLTANWQNIPGIIIQAFQQMANDPHVKIFINALQDAGAWIVAQFIPVWQQLVTTFQTQVAPAFEHLQQTIGPMLPILKMAGEVVAGVLLLFLGLAVSLIAGFISALANFLQGAIQFIGGVIQVFTGLIEFFNGMWIFLYDLFTGNWAKLGADLQVMATGIGDIFMGLWNMIMGYLKMSFGTVLGFAWGFVTGFIGFFKFLYDELVGHSIIPDLINGILKWIGSLPGQALAFINQMVTNLLSKFDTLKANAITKAQEVVSGITDKLGNLGNLALSWGQDLMSKLIAGINGGLGNLSNAAQNVAGTISKWIHFSLPDIGPLKDADKWMPDFTDLLSRGLRAGVPKLQSAMGELAMPLTVMASQNHASSASIAASAVSMPTSGNSQPFVIQLQMPDGDTFAEYLVDPVMRRVMRTTNRKSGRRGL